MIKKYCELCKTPFLSRLNVTRFCSIACRNTYLARKYNKMIIGKKCMDCGKVMYKSHSDLCKKCVIKRDPTRYWTKEETEYLVANYSTLGADEISKHIPKNRTQVQNKASFLHLRLDKETTRKLVHNAAAENMRKNNPSKLPGATERLRKQALNPERMMNVMIGIANRQRKEPNKLELRFFAILDKLGISYQHHVLIKPKFVVDVMIGNYIVQIDGDWWHGHPKYINLVERQIKQQRKDKAQDAYLKACGYTVIRIWESDTNIEFIKQVLKQHNLLS